MVKLTYLKFIFYSILLTTSLYGQYNSDLKFILKTNSKTISGKNTNLSLPSEINELKFFAIRLIRIYQIFISSQDMPNCIFSPSCSRFGATSIQKYGLIKGCLMTSDRLQRCNYFAGNYYSIDPVTGKLNDPIEKYSIWE